MQPRVILPASKYFIFWSRGAFVNPWIRYNY